MQSNILPSVANRLFWYPHKQLSNVNQCIIILNIGNKALHIMCPLMVDT